MAQHLPDSGLPIQLIGYTWASGRLELLWRPWPAADPAAASLPLLAATEPDRWPVVRGASISLSAARPGLPGERRCIGFRPPAGGPPQPCPEWRSIAPRAHAQCPECERREGRL
jgi:hypothetical protein